MVNGWSDDLKAKKLPTLPEGEALGVWLEFTIMQQLITSYQLAKSKIFKMVASFSDLQFTCGVAIPVCRVLANTPGRNLSQTACLHNSF